MRGAPARTSRRRDRAPRGRPSRGRAPSPSSRAGPGSDSRHPTRDNPSARVPRQPGPAEQDRPALEDRAVELAQRARRRRPPAAAGGRCSTARRSRARRSRGRSPSARPSSRTGSRPGTRCEAGRTPSLAPSPRSRPRRSARTARPPRGRATRGPNRLDRPAVRPVRGPRPEAARSSAGSRRAAVGTGVLRPTLRPDAAPRASGSSPKPGSVGRRPVEELALLRIEVLLDVLAVEAAHPQARPGPAGRSATSTAATGRRPRDRSPRTSSPRPGCPVGGCRSGRRPAARHRTGRRLWSTRCAPRSRCGPPASSAVSRHSGPTGAPPLEPGLEAVDRAEDAVRDQRLRTVWKSPSQRRFW